MVNTVVEWLLMIVFAILLIIGAVVFIPIACVMVLACAVRGDFVDTINKNY